MENLLIISADASLFERLEGALATHASVARASSWDAARQQLMKYPARVVVVGPDLAQPSQSAQFVALDSVLSKDGTPAFLLAERLTPALVQVGEAFASIADVLALPRNPDDWRALLEMLLKALQAQPPSQANQDSPFGASSPQLSVRLPKLARGTLSSLSFSRLLYSISMHRESGVLTLQSGHINRVFGFKGGHFLEPMPGAALADSAALTGVFAWPDGEFTFHQNTNLQGTRTSLVPLMVQGVNTHLPQREIMNRLMPMMASYPVLTQFWEKRRASLRWGVLAKLMGGCDGQRSLERLLSLMGSDVTEGFRAALFAKEIDLWVFRREPCARAVTIHYDHLATGSTPATTSPASNRPARTSSSANSRQVQPAAFQAPAGLRPATGRTQSLDVQLREKLQSLEQMSSHEIFGVWKGCGREVVKERFYILVKEHHPDVYGGNVSAEIKDTAQRIFIGVRNAYTELMKVEHEQTLPPPGATASSPTPPAPGQPAFTPRKRLSTLHPGQFHSGEPQGLDEESQVRFTPRTQTPGRVRRDSTPIRMKRTPTNHHPDLQNHGAPPASGHTTPSGQPQGSPSNAQETRRDRTASLSGARLKRTTSLSGAGLGRESSDVEWRKEQLERLGKSPTRTRRPTPAPLNNAGIPGPADPARDAFNAGYPLFKQLAFRDALPHLQRALKLEPQNGLYMTFEAYTRFQLDAHQADAALAQLDKAISSGHRQAMPDAHLFSGIILKAQGKERQAYECFQNAYRLNPASLEAEREIRLYERRHSADEGQRGFFKNLFKK
ncbi:hypothetical protein DL240_01740 [Lujinxingia litoralis]|uniref:PatA-like N-terminal domain-containing protein n=1 Tax=Lujinxingia litoralis TaxID=2211119 RepID=A0A328C8L9_9DELT|nr:DUF4388 domain-containing protein [Lujinxingia litoralis]RAL24957.1 hypothetical protein DL240_01740 [Lujinxingia litoralis]